MLSFHLENSFIDFLDPRITEFVTALNRVKNFTEIFDEFPIDHNYELGKAYENTGTMQTYISINEIETVIRETVDVVRRFGNKINLTIKIFDDGGFTLYLVVKDNQTYDIATQINNFMTQTEQNL